MSAEKEVVNFWLNRRGFFTISNLKIKNKDIGILALKYDEGDLKNITHVEICCSITGFIDQGHIFEKIIFEKFNDKNVKDAIAKYIKDDNIKVENFFVINSLPKDNQGLASKFEKNGIALIEFEDVLADVLKELDTSYFKNDTIRTLQLVKFLLMTNPKKFIDVLYKNLSPAKRREFLAEILNNDEIIKEFKKTNEERLAIILKQAMIKPEKLAQMLENGVLNNKTRKPFINSLMEQEKSGKIYKQVKQNKKEMPLIKFFE